MATRLVLLGATGLPTALATAGARFGSGPIDVRDGMLGLMRAKGRPLS